MRSLRRPFLRSSHPAIQVTFLGMFAFILSFTLHSVFFSVAPIYAQPQPKTPASRETSREIETVIAQGSGTLQGNQTPFDGQTYRIHPIDTRQFTNGGTLIIDITVGSGRSAASFGLLSEGVPRGKIAYWDSHLSSRGDVPPGTKTQIIYRFNRGQVFQFVAGGNWFSPRTATNSYSFVARVKVTEPRPELRFVREVSGRFEAVKDELKYGESFYVEARFSTEPSEKPGTVTLEWGAEKPIKVELKATQDSKVFRSGTLYLEPPAPGAGGGGRK